MAECTEWHPIADATLGWSHYDDVVWAWLNNHALEARWYVRAFYGVASIETVGGCRNDRRDYADLLYWFVVHGCRVVGYEEYYDEESGEGGNMSFDIESRVPPAVLVEKFTATLAEAATEREKYGQLECANCGRMSELYPGPSFWTIYPAAKCHGWQALTGDGKNWHHLCPACMAARRAYRNAERELAKEQKASHREAKAADAKK